jgi:chromosome segregation ATPase
MDLKELDEQVKDFVGKVVTVNKLLSALDTVKGQYDELLSSTKAFIKEKEAVNAFGDSVNQKLELLTNENVKRNEEAVNGIKEVTEEIQGDLGSFQEDLNAAKKDIVSLTNELKNIKKELGALQDLIQANQTVLLEKIAALHHRVENPPKKGLFGLG